VRLKDSAWTVGNRPGNNRGINWEFAGFARQSRAEWLDAFGLKMFHQAAPYIRLDAREYGIPLKRCSVSDLKAFRPGVTSHNDLRLAFGQTTHTDPGPNFPWDVFLQILEGDMATLDETAAYAYNTSAIVRGLCLGHDMVPQKRRDGTAADPISCNALVDRIANAVVAKLPPGSAGLDDAALAAIAKAVNDDAHQRSAS
jgi:hypothetical protein